MQVKTSDMFFHQYLRRTLAFTLSNYVITRLLSVLGSRRIGALRPKEGIELYIRLEYELPPFVANHTHLQKLESKYHRGRGTRESIACFSSRELGVPEEGFGRPGVR